MRPELQELFTQILSAVLGALGGAVASLRGRAAWMQHRVKRDGIPRCPVCAHRCASCKQTAAMRSEPPPNYREGRWVDETRDFPTHEQDSLHSDLDPDKTPRKRFRPR